MTVVQGLHKNSNVQHCGRKIHVENGILQTNHLCCQRVVYAKQPRFFLRILAGPSVELVDAVVVSVGSDKLRKMTIVLGQWVHTMGST